MVHYNNDKGTKQTEHVYLFLDSDSGYNTYHLRMRLQRKWSVKGNDKTLT